MTSLSRRNDVGGGEAAAPGEVRRWRAFSLLAVAYFMTVVDLHDRQRRAADDRRQAALSPSRTCSGW